MKSDLEQYWQQGGTYVVPVEVINYWSGEVEDLQQEITKLKGVIETYEILIKANNINNWNEFKKWLEDSFYWAYYEENMSSGWVVEIMKEKMQELENKQCHTTSE